MNRQSSKNCRDQEKYGHRNIPNYEKNDKVCKLKKKNKAWAIKKKIIKS